MTGQWIPRRTALLPLILLAACARNPGIRATDFSTIPPPSATATQMLPTLTYLPTATRTATSTRTITPTITLTPTVTPTLEAALTHPCAVAGNVNQDQSDYWFGIFHNSRENQIMGVGLSRMDDTVEGFYFTRKELKDYPIYGCLGSGGQVVFEIDTPGGEKYGLFRGFFPETDPDGRYGYNPGEDGLGRQVLDGLFLDAKTGNSQPWILYMDGGTFRDPANPWDLSQEYGIAGALDASIVNRAAQTLVAAVAANDRWTVAALVSYPIRITIGNEKIQFENKAEFVSMYNRIFTWAMKQKLAQSIPMHMWSNWSGIMLARGAVWFDVYGNIVGINIPLE